MKGSVEKIELGIVIALLSIVTMLVILKPILVTVPICPDTSIKSPTLKLLVPKTNNPDIKLDKVSLAAKPTAIPRIPKLKTKPVILIPRKSRIIITAIVIIEYCTIS